ncbi:MAG: class I SAM-dependent methyltransferase [Minisyncoccia bacterium]
MDLKKAQDIIKETRQNYETIARHFDQTRQNLWPEFKDLKQFFQPHNKVLDFGCGNGRFYELIKDLTPEYYGVDLSSQLISFARQKIPQGHFLLVDDNLNLSFSDNFFDVITCLATFHHLPSKELELHLLEEFFRVLKPRGYLILTVWDFYHGKNTKYLVHNYLLGLKHFFFSKNIQYLGFKDFYLPWKDNQAKILTKRYFHAFTLKELNHLTTRAGFKILSSQLEPHNKKKDYYNLIIIAQKIN